MRSRNERRGFLLIAAIAIGVALLAMLVPHGLTGHGPDWLAILPILFLGIVSPLSLLPPMPFAYAGRAPQPPVLASLFQRPPPSPQS
jgi:hypothetical protein